MILKNKKSKQKTELIRPEEVYEVKDDSSVKTHKERIFEVHSIFNKNIFLNWDGTQSLIPQNDVCKEICDVLKISYKQAVAEGYLDIEEHYRSVGWNVRFIKSTSNSYNDAVYVFTKKRKLEHVTESVIDDIISKKDEIILLNSFLNYVGDAINLTPASRNHYICKFLEIDQSAVEKYKSELKL